MKAIVYRFPNIGASALAERNAALRGAVTERLDIADCSRRLLAGGFGVTWGLLDRWFASEALLPNAGY